MGGAAGDAGTSGGAAMEGRGFYNAHSQPQQAAARLGTDLLERAAARLAPDRAPIVIADYGSAEGRNSLAPMGAAIGTLRRRCRAPVAVVHVDRPGNDFSSLFGLLRGDAGSYLAAADEVFAYACGGSFYERLFPARSVALGWSSIALHWLSRIPAGSVGPAWPSLLGAGPREPFARQADRDWRAFLAHRAAELRPGGGLVVVVPATDRHGAWSLSGLARHISAVLTDLAAEGILRPAELARMVVPVYNRNVEEFEAPFADPGLGLTLEVTSVDQTPDPLWDSFQAHGDPVALADGYAGFARASFGPTLAGALDSERTADERQAFLARLTAGVRRRVLAQPAMLAAPTVMTMLIAKHAG